MYHAFVCRRVRALFDSVNDGRAAYVLANYAHEFEHICVGQHALGGRRTRIGPMLDWYARMYRLLPNVHFEVTKITPCGGPWKTVVLVEWVTTNLTPDGVQMTGTGVHMIHLRWGRMVQLFICPYADALSGPLEALARAGVAEARAAPIE